MASSSRKSLLSGLLLLAFTFFVYWGVFQNGFVDFDDNVYVTENPITEAGLTWTGFRYAWTTFDSGNWIPLTWLSYQLDVTLWGRYAWSFHATNLTIHILNVLLLFALLNRLCGLLFPNFLIAALFAVHPLHVESVAWIAERKDVLSAFWLLLTLLIYEKYATGMRLSWYLAACLAFALGLLSKSMLVTAPVLLLLLDFWPLERVLGLNQTNPNGRPHPRQSLKMLLLEKVPFLVLAFIDGIATIVSQSAVHAGTSLTRLPLLFRLGNAINGYCWYLRKTFWPTGLCVHYAHPMDKLNWCAVLISVGFLCTVSLYVGIAGYRRRHLMFGWLWFVISLAPVIGILQVGTQAYADRYSYLPHVGLLWLIVSETQFWLGRSTWRQRTGAVAAIVVIGGLGYATMVQVAVWKSTDTLWSQALAVDPENWFAHLQVGNRMVLNGRADDVALGHFDVVLKHDSKHAIALNNIGWIHQSRGDWETAERFYRRSLASDPLFRQAMHNLVTVVKKQGRLAAEVDFLEAFVERSSGDAKVLKELGMVYVRRGQMEMASDRFQRAVRIDPQDRDARNNLALTFLELGRLNEAKSQLEIILSQNPSDSNGLVNLGLVLEKLGQFQAAYGQFAAAVRLNPTDREALGHLQRLEKRPVRP